MGSMVRRASVPASCGAAMLGTAALGAVILLSGFASQGHAAQSVNPPISFPTSTAPSGSYYEQNGANTCGTPGGGSSGTTSGPTGTAIECKISFTAVPSGKSHVIEHVACNLRLGGDVHTEINLASASGVNDACTTAGSALALANNRSMTSGNRSSFPYLPTPCGSTMPVAMPMATKAISATDNPMRLVSALTVRLLDASSVNMK